MAHHWGMPILVERDPQSAAPRAFTWRGVRYDGLQVLATWHVVDRWWEASNPYARRHATDRVYYRVLCELRAFASLAVFELYFDRAANTWVLDREYD
jgi:hypothetical protein